MGETAGGQGCPEGRPSRRAPEEGRGSETAKTTAIGSCGPEGQTECEGRCCSTEPDGEANESSSRQRREHEEDGGDGTGHVSSRIRWSAPSLEYILGMN